MDHPDRKPLRLPEYEYATPGAYFVSICVKDRTCRLGEINGGLVVLTGEGEIAQGVLQNIPEQYLGIEIDCFVIMPNHVHAVIMINECTEVAEYHSPSLRAGLRPAPTTEANSQPVSPNSPDQINQSTPSLKVQPSPIGLSPVGAGLRPALPPDQHSFPSWESNTESAEDRITNSEPATTLRYQDEISATGSHLVGAGLRPALPPNQDSIPLSESQPGSALPPGEDSILVSPPTPSLSEIIRAFKSFSAREINQKRNTSGKPFWQRNYYEHIIRSETDLAAIRQYISNNPLTWGQDPESPQRTTGNTR